MFRELTAFDLTHTNLDWPWVAFALDRVAYASSTDTIATRILDRESVADGPSFTLPADLRVGAGLRAFAVAGARVALAGARHVAVVAEGGERARAEIGTLLGAGHELRALAFDRTGRRLWLSAETETETVIALVDAETLALVGVQRSAALPRPALHELHVHPHDDAVLLVAACGEEGTFARVVGFAGDEVSAVPSALDAGALAAGFVGYSADGLRVHLVEADELRTHAWPTLDELSSVPLADDFVSSFSGAVFGPDILIDGEHADGEEDALMLFDRAAIHGVVLPLEAPAGMWAGRLGSSAVVVLEPTPDAARARVLLRIPDAATKAFGERRLLS